MALVLADRVQEYSTTTGTGTLTLLGAYAGFQTFAAGIGNGNTCYYTITSDTNQWEVGIGTVGVGTLARTTLISSSTGAKVSFTGTLTVFVTYPAEKAVYSDSTTIVAPAGALLPITSGGTGASTAATARTALGLGTIATQDANAVAITGGAIDGTTVGATTVAAGSFTTLNSSGATRLGGLSGNQSLQVDNVASAVDYLRIIGNSAGFPNLQGQGNSANVSIVYSTKGTGNHNFTTNGASINQVIIAHTASAVNYLNLTGAATTAAPTLSAQGSDADVGLNFAMKGWNAIKFSSTTGGQLFQIGQLTSATANYFQALGNSTGNAPVFSAQGTDTNVGLVLTGKGTGVVALGGSTVANSSLVANPTASSANYVQVTGGAGTTWPSISSLGTAATSGFFFNAKSAGYSFAVNGAANASISYTASAVNYLQLAGAVTTGAPEISAQGSDTNINIKLTPKGTGTVQFGTYTAGILAQAGYITITDAGGTSRRLLVG